MGKQSRRFHSADRFSIQVYASDERFTAYLDSAGGGAVILMGHKSVQTTMIYTHVFNRGGLVVRSPVDG